MWPPHASEHFQCSGSGCIHAASEEAGRPCVISGGPDVASKRVLQCGASPPPNFITYGFRYPWGVLEQIPANTKGPLEIYN